MMNPWLVLLVGMVVVVGGILAFRLHAFLALTLAALVVGWLTPSNWVRRYERSDATGKVVEVVKAEAQADPAHGPLYFFDKKKQAVHEGMEFLVFPPGDELDDSRRLARLRVLGEKEVEKRLGRPLDEAEQNLTGAERIDEDAGLTAQRGIEPQDRVINLAAWEAADKTASRTAIERVANGFGATCAKIGILIAMASIIGKCLLESGAADRIIRTSLRFLGEARASLAFLFSGFTLGIPVFFDTVFYLMIPLGKALRMRTGRNYLLYVLTITAGASMAHSLVPPTPGPLLVANELNVNLGVMILGGCFVGIFTSAFGYFYAHWINRRVEIPLRDSPDAPLAELEKMAHCDESQLPPFWLSLAPIILPVILIAGGTILDKDVSGLDLPATVKAVIDTVSNKNVALILAAAIALYTLVWQKRASKLEVANSVQTALSSGGVIILITAAGGAFGGMLKQTGIGDRIADLTPEAYPLLVLPVAFGITTLVRTAQGSATVAMITAVGILAPLAAARDLGYHNVYLALAIGCGSKPIAWMNDSGFWVICKMSGMTEGETLKTLTPMTACMGVVGLIVTMITAWLAP